MLLDITWREEKRRIADLKEYANNPRKMTKDAFEKLVESLQSDGYHMRLLVNLDGTIIGGHQRKKALLKAGFKKTDEIEVLVPNRLLAETEYDRVNIRDNLPYGAFDFDILANNFDKQQLIDWGMPEEWLTGDEEPEEEIELSAEDEAIPDEPVEPITKLGDVWLLGDHRLMCGDSTDALAVERLLNGLKPNLMVTDPPYGVEYKPEWRNEVRNSNSKSVGKVLNDHRADWSETYSLFPGDVAYVWHSALHSHTFAQNLIDCGYKLVAQIIWSKSNFALSRGDYHWHHEPCWYAVKEGQPHAYNGARDQSTIWKINIRDKGGEKYSHGTQKPIECMLKPILNNSKPGEAIYDPFLGSGTTLIACEKSGRQCLGMELSPAYCDVIVSRWEKMTGDKAELEQTDE